MKNAFKAVKSILSGRWGPPVAFTGADDDKEPLDIPALLKDQIRGVGFEDSVQAVYSMSDRCLIKPETDAKHSPAERKRALLYSAYLETRLDRKTTEQITDYLSGLFREAGAEVLCGYHDEFTETGRGIRIQVDLSSREQADAAMRRITQEFWPMPEP